MSSRRTRERLARMPRAVRLGGVALALAVFGSVWAAPARADVIIQCEALQNGTNVPGSGSLLGCTGGPLALSSTTDLVKFNSGLIATGTTVQGLVTDSSNVSTIVNFSSTTDNLIINNGGGGGAAQIQTNNTGNPTDTFINNLTTFIPSGQTYNSFTPLELNIQSVSHTTGAVSFTINAVSSTGTAETFNTVNFDLGAGQNVFAFQTINGEVLTSVTFNALPDVVSAVGADNNVKQIRLNPTNSPTAVPEPGTLALLGSGLLGLGLVLRRRRVSLPAALPAAA